MILPPISPSSSCSLSSSSSTFYSFSSNCSSSSFSSSSSSSSSPSSSFSNSSSYSFSSLALPVPPPPLLTPLTLLVPHLPAHPLSLVPPSPLACPLPSQWSYSFCMSHSTCSFFLVPCLHCPPPHLLAIPLPCAHFTPVIAHFLPSLCCPPPSPLGAVMKSLSHAD